MSRAALTAVLVLLLLLLAGVAPARTRQEKVAEVKDVMKANKPGGLYFGIVRELKAGDTDWADAAQDSKELARLAAELPKLKPPQGDAASWARLSKGYAGETAALSDAVRRKDKRTALAVVARLEASCDACHKIHRKE